MKARTVTATFVYTESGKRELRTVNCLFSDRNEQYEINPVYVVEEGRELVFDKNTNEFLVPK